MQTCISEQKRDDNNTREIDVVFGDKCLSIPSLFALAIYQAVDFSSSDLFTAMPFSADFAYGFRESAREVRTNAGVKI